MMRPDPASTSFASAGRVAAASAAPGHEPAAAAPIRVLLFAGLREAAGWAECSWPAPAGAAHLTPREIWSGLRLPGDLSAVRVAINQRFADADTPLHSRDELAFLPPISGG